VFSRRSRYCSQGAAATVLKAQPQTYFIGHVLPLTLFWSLDIGIYLEFGAWDLALAAIAAPCNLGNHASYL